MKRPQRREQTIVAGDDLYRAAQASMEESWLSDVEDAVWADMGPDELLALNSGDIVLDSRVDRLEQSVSKLVQEGDDDD